MNQDSSRFVDVTVQGGNQIHYDLFQTNSSQHEYDDSYIQDEKRVRQYNLLIDALKEFVAVSKGKVSLHINSNNSGSGPNPEQSCYLEFLEQFQPGQFKSEENKQQLPKEQFLGKAFEDLFNQLQELHQFGLLVGHFNFDWFGYSPNTDKYFMVAFPTLTLADDAMLRGSYAFRVNSGLEQQYLGFSQASKQSDYLDLVKQFLIAASQYDDLLEKKYDASDPLVVPDINSPECFKQYGIIVDNTIIEQLQAQTFKLSKKYEIAKNYQKNHKPMFIIDPELIQKHKRELKPLVERIFSEELFCKVNEIEELKRQVIDLQQNFVKEKKEINCQEPDYSEKNEVIDAINSLIELYNSR